MPIPKRTSASRQVYFSRSLCIAVGLAIGVSAAGLPIAPKRHHRASPQNPLSNAKMTQAVMFDEILAHYHLNEIHRPSDGSPGATGKGQHIALLNYDKVTDETRQDVQEFFGKAHSRAQVNFIGTGSEDDTAPTELELDIEMAGLVAPDAIIDVYSFDEGVSDEVELGEILSHPEVRIISSSWSGCEREVTPESRAAVDTLLQAAADRGVTVLYASGDLGLACNNNKPGDDEGRSTRSWPTTNPNVTAVGATSFEGAKDGATGEFHEVAWRHSGGGPSLLYGMPSYQAGWLPPVYDEKKSGKGWRRGIPDIAMLGGEPGIQIWARDHGEKEGSWHPGAGTSFASPEFAGFIALVNEARGSKRPIGSLNPILYQMAGAEREIVLRAISEVDQGARKTPQFAWNAMTGLGAPIPVKLFAYLVSLP